MTCQREALLAQCGKGDRSATGNPRSGSTDGRSPGREAQPQATYIRAWDRETNPKSVGELRPHFPDSPRGPDGSGPLGPLTRRQRISTLPDTEQARHHHEAIKNQRHLEHAYRSAMSALIDVGDVREVTAKHELYRRLVRTSDHLALLAGRVWYAVLKAS